MENKAKNFRIYEKVTADKKNKLQKIFFKNLPIIQIPTNNLFKLCEK